MIIINKRFKKGLIILAGVITVWLVTIVVGEFYQPQSASVLNIPAESTVSNEKVLDVGAQADENFFAEYRLSRDRVRSKELDMLRAIVNDPASLQKAREAAYLKMVNMADLEEKEMQAETLIKAQGYEDCAVVISMNTTTVMLGESTTSLNQQEIKKAVGLATGSKEPAVSVLKIQN